MPPFPRGSNANGFQIGRQITMSVGVGSIHCCSNAQPSFYFAMGGTHGTATLPLSGARDVYVFWLPAALVDVRP
eukprot:4175851-Pyramimonas_sp.AAC.1